MEITRIQVQHPRLYGHGGGDSEVSSSNTQRLSPAAVTMAAQQLPQGRATVPGAGPC